MTIANKINISVLTYFVHNYLSALIMALVNFTLIPYLVGVISSYEGSTTKSKTELKIMSKDLFFLIMCSLVLPILSLTTI